MLCFCKNEMEKIRIGKNDYYLCNSCGYLKKAKILNEEEEKKRYDKHVCDSSYLIYMNEVFNKLKPYLNKGKCLDFGCGKLHALSDILNNNGYISDYYDLYYFNKPIIASFDNIILIEVFEHIEDIYSLLVSLKEKLNSKGRIIIMTKPKPKELKGWWYLRDTTHISFIEYRTMKRLGELLDLELIYDEINSLFIFCKN